MKNFIYLALFVAAMFGLAHIIDATVDDGVQVSQPVAPAMPVAAPATATQAPRPAVRAMPAHDVEVRWEWRQAAPDSGRIVHDPGGVQLEDYSQGYRRDGYWVYDERGNRAYFQHTRP